MGIFGNFGVSPFRSHKEASGNGVEKINTFDKIKNFNNWDHPSFSAEEDKVNSFAKNKLNLNEDNIIAAVYKIDKLIDSDDIEPQELDEELWSKLQDDDSHGMSKIEDESELISFIDSLGKTGKELFNKIVNNKMVEVPVIIKQKENFYVLTGEKRLKIFRAAGVTPKVKIIDLDTIF